MGGGAFWVYRGLGDDDAGNMFELTEVEALMSDYTLGDEGVMCVGVGVVLRSLYVENLNL